MKLRNLERQEMRDLWSLDRAEVIDNVYRRAGDELVLRSERHEIEGWLPGEPELHGPMLLDCFDRGGSVIGAFEAETLIGAVWPTAFTLAALIPLPAFLGLLSPLGWLDVSISPWMSRGSDP